ncbi:transcriptional regulator [Gordonibacter sp. 28C]|uniref:sensor histidine kinase n=1 Tax=Gordonibacter sp. 28C TaxID=2078569 RepID=UPI000DF7507A|nr:histidine kinase [Gordonibacter sp. 28C]RDB62299.1 transcriptional regulator [Gordonibacter sp. 28C]
MNQFNIALDVYSALLCLVLGAYVLVSGNRHDRANLCFAGICVCNAVMALGDMTAWMFAAPLDGVEYAVMLVGTFAFYVAPAPLFMFFTGYIQTYLSKRAPLARSYLPLSVALFTLYTLGCTVSLFNGMFFLVDPATGYERGPLFWLAQVVPVALHLRNAGIVVRHRSCLERKELLGFASYIALPIVAEVVQVAFFGIALMNTAVALAILLVFLSIQSERKALLAQRERELAEARSDIMLSQIQPHFLYNTLAAIRELCASDPAEAARAVTDFSSFLRENMASLTSKQPIPFERELRHTTTYLNLEQRRFGGRLRVEFDIASRDFELPPLTVQALAENAVRHGVSPREEGGCVRVSSHDDEGGHVVEVQDDGVGFDPSAAPDDERIHVGIQNVRVRLAEGCQGTLDVRSAPGDGTVATIRIPCAQDESDRPDRRLP